MKKIIITLAVLFSINANSAESVQLKNGCQELLDNKDTWSAGHCVGVIEMFATYVLPLVKERNDNDPEIKHNVCLPDKVNAFQLAAVYVKYVNENPDKWHMVQGHTLSYAFQEAFPCE